VESSHCQGAYAAARGRAARKRAGNVRCQGTNGPGPMGRLNRPIRIRFRDEIKSLLRGQVILST
jgi:hypothetical protein